MPFRDIIGHRAAVRLLARAVRRETLPPSLLLAGPDGVGKHRVAIAVAQAQNCQSPVMTEDGEGQDACGACAPCRRIERGSFSDVLDVQPGENGTISVDAVRNATGQANFRPFEGRRRVVIVTEADRLVTAAQNAFLKTLEEPPASSQFVLVSARPDALLPTVRSRCQRLGFGQLTVDDVAMVLATIHDGTAAEVRAAAAASGGSVGRALRLATGELEGARDAALVLLRAAAAPGGRARLEGAKAIIPKGRTGAAVRRDLGRALDAMSSLLRDIAAVASGADMTRLANADLEDSLRQLSSIYGGRRGVQAFQAVIRARDAVESNVSPKVVTDWLACHL